MLYILELVSYMALVSCIALLPIRSIWFTKMDIWLDINRWISDWLSYKWLSYKDFCNIKIWKPTLSNKTKKCNLSSPPLMPWQYYPTEKPYNSSNVEETMKTDVNFFFYFFIFFLFFHCLFFLLFFSFALFIFLTRKFCIHKTHKSEQKLKRHFYALKKHLNGRKLLNCLFAFCAFCAFCACKVFP